LIDQSLAHQSTTGIEITIPIEEELLAACEFALEWFEDWSKHADHEHDFGGEGGRSDEEAQEGDRRGVDQGRVVIRAIAAGVAFVAPAVILLHVWPG
jgi:hypothetical protein